MEKDKAAAKKPVWMIHSPENSGNETIRNVNFTYKKSQGEENHFDLGRLDTRRVLIKTNINYALSQFTIMAFSYNFLYSGYYIY